MNRAGNTATAAERKACTVKACATFVIATGIKKEQETSALVVHILLLY
jgi:hypothetical protein